ncbi:MAG: lysine-sensitive aspartokinase 3 [Acidobacteriota bacterium]|jgi:aspartate kinase|nr:lysine-sensitive aspartokinase 3 [Acidobacteriota bacterium]NLT34010.1 lysine-sensitive aspartokinase 3 [Acidobacteriota bacterium]
MIVCKFGGSSVQDADALMRLAGIIRSQREQKPIVVSSAMGKTTNNLLEVARTAAQGKKKEALDLLAKIKDRHLGEARKLGIAVAEDQVSETINTYFKEMRDLVRGLAALGELTPRITDAMASYGERLSTLIIARLLENEGLPAELMDARECIITDDRFTRAAPLFDLTEAAIVEQFRPVLRSGKIPVFQGFIGRTRDGITTTIGRGGSDFTAAIVGAALDAEDIQIWTDVDGIMTTDPHMVEDARRIRVISFNEAAELAYFGAKVLHPATIIPAVRKKIPVHVLNSSKPDHEGTLITNEAACCDNPIKAIAYKSGITVVNITSTRMFMAYGFLKKIFEIFEQYKVPVDVVATSEVSVSLTVDETSNLEDIVADLRKIGEVNIEGSKSIVCCVGDNVRNVPGLPYIAFSALRDIRIQMISQGASAINITFVIDDDQIPKAVRKLHDAFFQKVDPRIFE